MEGEWAAPFFGWRGLFSGGSPKLLAPSEIEHAVVTHKTVLRHREFGKAPQNFGLNMGIDALIEGDKEPAHEDARERPHLTSPVHRFFF